MNGHEPASTNHPSPCTAWGPRGRPKPVIWLASDFSPLSLTQHSGFHYHFIVYLRRLRTGEVTVIITDRTKTALFPVWWARSQERGGLRGQAVNGELMPVQQLACNTDNMQLLVIPFCLSIGVNNVLLYYNSDLFCFSHLPQKWFIVIDLECLNVWWFEWKCTEWKKDWGQTSWNNETHSDMLSDSCPKRSPAALLILDLKNETTFSGNASAELSRFSWDFKRFKEGA